MKNKISFILAIVFSVFISGFTINNEINKNEKSILKNQIEVRFKTKANLSTIKKNNSANDIYIFKDMSCNDAACKCNECYFKFISVVDGKELIINEINEKITSIKLFETIEHNDEGGWIEMIPNKKYINKKFKITFSITKCKCDDAEPNNNYKKLTSLKIIE